MSGTYRAVREAEGVQAEARHSRRRTCNGVIFRRDQGAMACMIEGGKFRPGSPLSKLDGAGN